MQQRATWESREHLTARLAQCPVQVQKSWVIEMATSLGPVVTGTQQLLLKGQEPSVFL